MVAWIDARHGVVMSVDEEVVTSNPRVRVRHSLTLQGADSWLLTIRHVTHHDQGTYMCQLNTKQLRRHYHLIVVVPPVISDGTNNETGDLEVSEGAPARLSCEATGVPQPTITWRREDHNLIRVDDDKEEAASSHDTGGALVWDRVSREDAGAYLCIAKNGVPPSVSKRVKLLVRFPPEVTTPDSLLGVPLGSNVTLTCRVLGFPLPGVHWVRDGAELIHTQTYRYHLRGQRIIQVEKFRTLESLVSNTEKLAMLTVRDIQASDITGYRCRANNSQDHVEARITLYDRLRSYS
ncbi:unnamed protein product, partial [Meganyctiphanes norvegica]